MPSRRRQTWATAGAFSAVRAKPGRDGRGPLDEQAHGLDLGQACRRQRRRRRRHREGGRPARSSPRRRPAPPGWWPGCAGAGRRAAARRPGAAQASTRCSQLSSTSSRRAGRGPAARVNERPARAPRGRRAPAATAWGHERRIGQRGQLDQPDAVRVVADGSRRRPAAPGASCPLRRRRSGSPGAPSDGQPSPLSRRCTTPASRSRPTKLVRGAGRRVRRLGRALEGELVPGAPPGRRLEQGLRERCLARRREQGLGSTAWAPAVEIERRRRSGPAPPGRPPRRRRTLAAPWRGRLQRRDELGRRLDRSPGALARQRRSTGCSAGGACAAAGTGADACRCSTSVAGRPAEGGLPFEQGVEDDAEGVDVARGRRRAPAAPLRRAVRRRPDEGTGDGQAGHPLGAGRCRSPAP